MSRPGRNYGTLRWLAPTLEDPPRHRAEWCVEATPDVSIELKRIFGRLKRGKSKELLVADTPEVCRKLNWAMMMWPLEMDAYSRQRLREGTSEHMRLEEQVTRVLDGEELRIPERRVPAREPRPYQAQAADLLISTGRLLLLDELGLGKTFSLLLTLQAADALPALVVTLTHLPEQWLEELHLAFPELRGHVVRSAAVYDPSKKREMRGRHPDVLIMNYNKVSGWAQHLAGQINTILMDEIQELRTGDASNKYWGCRLIAQQAKYRGGATATPVYNYGGEVHNVVSVLDEGVLGTREEFVREWGSGESGTKTKIEEPAALGQYLRHEGIVLRRTRAEVGLELPPVQKVPHICETDGETLFKLTAGVVDLAEMIAEKKGDHREVFKASGELDYRLRHATGVAKAPYVAAFVRMLLETEEKVVLFGWHHDVYDIWMDAFSEWGFNPVFYTGKQATPAAKAKAKAAFVDGDSRVLVMSLRAGAGLNGLQDVCKVCVFGELDWSPGMHDQCIGRLQRDREEDYGKVDEAREDIDHVVAYYLTANEGSDPVVAGVLNVKRQQSEPLVDPDAPLFEGASDDGDRVRRLAAYVLEQRDGPDRHGKS